MDLKFFLKVLKIHLFFPKKTERRISKKRLKKWGLYHRFIFSKQELGSTREFNFTAVSKLGFFFYRPRGDSDPRFRSPIEKRPIFMYNMYSKIFWLFLTRFGSKKFFHPKYGLWGLKSKEIARAFTSRHQIDDFLLGTPFSYFLGTFWHFLAISVNFGPRLVYDSSKRSERVA